MPDLVYCPTQVAQAMYPETPFCAISSDNRKRNRKISRLSQYDAAMALSPLLPRGILMIKVELRGPVPRIFCTPRLQESNQRLPNL